MKRIFALALCLCMLLCACTGTTTPNEPKQQDDPVPAGQPEQPKAPVLRTERIILTDEAMQAARLNVEYDAVTVDGDGFDALNRALDAWSRSLADDLSTAAKNVRPDLEELNGVVSEDTSYALENSVAIVRADAQYVCLAITSYSSLGGVHPFTATRSVCFDTQTGSQLQLRDIAKDYDAVYQATQDALAHYEDREAFFEDYAGTVYDMFYTNEDDTLTWLLGEDTLTIVFSVYMIAPYAYGPLEVVLPFTDGTLSDGASGSVVTTLD